MIQSAGKFTAYGDVLRSRCAVCVSWHISKAAPVIRISRDIVSDTDTVRYFKIGFEALARSNRNLMVLQPLENGPNFGEGEL